jgi:hypothetical protein
MPTAAAIVNVDGEPELSYFNDAMLKLASKVDDIQFLDMEDKTQRKDHPKDKVMKMLQKKCLHQFYNIDSEGKSNSSVLDLLRSPGRELTKKWEKYSANSELDMGLRFKAKHLLSIRQKPVAFDEKECELVLIADRSSELHLYNHKKYMRQDLKTDALFMQKVHNIVNYTITQLRTVQTLSPEERFRTSKEF